MIRHVATQQSEERFARFMAEVSVYDPAMLLWIDESGCDRRDSIRKYGYSVRLMLILFNVLQKVAALQTSPVLNFMKVDPRKIQYHSQYHQLLITTKKL